MTYIQHRLGCSGYCGGECTTVKDVAQQQVSNLGLGMDKVEVQEGFTGVIVLRPREPKTADQMTNLCRTAQMVGRQAGVKIIVVPHDMDVMVITEKETT